MEMFNNLLMLKEISMQGSGATVKMAKPTKFRDYDSSESKRGGKKIFKDNRRKSGRKDKRDYQDAYSD
jgi:hypothetical protein